jgi:hypothetical protein
MARTRQPQQPTRIDRSNPLSRGLLRLWNFAQEPISLARSPAAIGQGVSISTSAGATLDSGSIRSAITNQLTWFGVFDFTATQSQFLLGDVEAGGAGYNSGLYVNAAGNPGFFVKVGGTGYFAIGSTALAGAGIVSYVGLWNGSFAQVRLNGVTDGGTGPVTAAGTLDSGAFGFQLNRWNAGNGQTGRAFVGGVANRMWSDADCLSFHRNPWQLFAPFRRVWVQLGPAAGGGAVTGTLAATDGADLAAFSGTHTAPGVTGTLSATEGADAASFSGAERITGTLAATDGADVAAFAGTHTRNATGTLAATDGADAASFSGTHTEAGVISGSLVATDGADAAAFAGAERFAGSLAATDGADRAAFTGIFLQNITGTLAATDGADSAAFAGSAAGSITGTLDATDGADDALFVSESLGGRPIFARRRKRYLVKDRVYDDLDPADVIAAAAEVGIDLGDVREVVKEPTQQKSAPRRADDDGREYWLPQEFWGRAAARQKLEATAPLGEEFQRAVEALRASAGPLQARMALRQRQEEEAIILLMA